VTRFFIGTSGWSYAHWKGAFYPENCPQSRWFDYYAARFRAVEVNATFYRRFKEITYQQWRQRAPAGFKYVLKAPRLITHRRYLKDAADLIREFWRSATLLEDRLGLILLQLAPGTPVELERLEQALRAFPDPTRVAVEFRHRDWYTPEVKDLLSELGAVFCNVDSPRTKLQDWLTAGTAYIRLHGRERWYAHDYTPAELKEITATARRLAAQGAGTVYLFFNNDFHGYAVRNALTLRTMLEPEHEETQAE
jgi:uncharacterized protein YecE (DUF72 family)